MADKRIVGESTGRPLDADLRFWGQVAGIIAKPSPPHKPSRLAEVRSNFWFTIGVITTIYLAWCVYDRFLGPLPTKVINVITDAAVPQVPIGGRLHVGVEVIRQRVCQRNYWWIISDHTGHRERYAEAPMDAIGRPGPDAFAQDFPISTNMKIGHAKLRVIWSWSCPENLFEAIYPVPLVLPDIPFEIVERPSQ